MTEAYICDYIRTPIGRYGGALSSVRADDLGAVPLKALMERNGSVDWEAVDDVIFGSANQAGEDNRNVARMSLLLAGLPVGVSGTTINRLCGSGMDAVITAARAIKAGEDYNISREDQDAFALRSQDKAAAAQANGRLAREIVSVTIPQRKGDPVIVEKDEHPRATSREALAKLPTPFRQGGTVTAGNASGVNDGAAALVIASEAAIRKYGLKPIARIIGGAAAGVPPRVMGIGPAPATRKLCARIGIAPDAFDVIELNEAFASQGLAVLRQLGIADDDKRVNPNGGAIALGHPLGMSGARIAGTAALELSLNNGKYALATMCIGVGQGIAIALERA
ncbi:acetyl-CoA C-acyltransferase [Brucella microti]|uniref:acetyl-CoA C-acyltransferase n=1 Tax=Brucella microti TaxID=444163 RepID=UPI0015C5396E|nr:acetyl-CoA C-acyltransferase [Brucella microti]